MEYQAFLNFRLIFVYYAGLFPIPEAENPSSSPASGAIAMCHSVGKNFPFSRSLSTVRFVESDGSTGREVFLGRPDQLVTRQQRAGGK